MGDKRLNSVTVYLNDEELAFTIEQADDSRRKVSDWVRNLIRDEMERHRERKIAAWHAEVQELRSRETRQDTVRAIPSSVADFTARARQTGPISFSDAFKDTEQQG